jgi:hypothetical protein
MELVIIGYCVHGLCHRPKCSPTICEVFSRQGWKPAHTPPYEHLSGNFANLSETGSGNRDLDSRQTLRPAGVEIGRYPTNWIHYGIVYWLPENSHTMYSPLPMSSVNWGGVGGGRVWLEVLRIWIIDNSQYRLLIGFSLLYTDRVPFELLDSAALRWRESCGGGGQTEFLNFTTIIYCKWRRCRQYMTSQVEDL